MAQRGGSVTSYLRFGLDVEGPLIPRGQTDVLLAFEASEAVRYFNYAGPKTTILINDLIIVPPMINQMEMDYPSKEQIHSFLKNVSDRIYFIRADELASNLGNPRVMNVLMLGFLFGSGNIPLERKKIEEAIIDFIPEKAYDINREAFQLGYDHGSKVLEGSYD